MDNQQLSINQKGKSPMIDFDLPIEPQDYIVIFKKENWTYITNNSVPGVEFNRYLISDFGRVFDLKNNWI